LIVILSEAKDRRTKSFRRPADRALKLFPRRPQKSDNERE
jgi:hypothetical protein